MNRKLFTLLCTLLMLSTLGGCNFDSTTNNSGTTPTTPSLALHGVAATGAAISGATIDLKCLNSSASYSTTSDANGGFSIDVSDTPCVVRVTFGSPTQTLYSVATAAGITDISPFSDLVFTALAQSAPATAYAGFPGNAASINSSALAAAIDLTQRRLSNLGVDVSSLDLLHQNFSPQNGDAYDDKLEALKTALQAQSLTLASLEDDVAHGRDQPAPVSVSVQTPTLNMAEPGDGLVRLSWSPAQSGVSYDVNYDIVTTPAPGSNPPPPHTLANVSSPATISGLTDGSQYYFTITAHSGNDSKTSGQLTATPHLYGVNFTAYPGYGNNNVKPRSAAYLRSASSGNDVYVGVYDTQHIVDVELDLAHGGLPTVQNVDASGGNTVQNLNAVASGKGVLIAAGTGGTILYSVDGHSWSQIHVAIANPGASTSLPEAGVIYHSISFANGRFVLVGRYSLSDGASADLLVMMSFNPEDAPTCNSGCSSSAPYSKSVTFLSPAISSGGDGLEVVTYGNGQFVAIGNPSLAATDADNFGTTDLTDGSTFAYTSSDGDAWVRHTVAPKDKVQQNPVRMVYAFGAYYALVEFNGGLFRSADGLVWSSTNGVSFVGSSPSDIAVGPGQMVSGDQLGDSFVCTNGSTWSKTQSGIGGTGNGGNASALAYGNGRYVAFGSGVYHSE
jgi:hypothetical protein